MRWLSNLQGTLGLRYGFDDDYASSAFFGGEVGGQAGKIHDSCRQDSELRKRTGFRSVIGKISYSVWGRLQRTSGNHGDIIFPAILLDDEKPSQSSNDTRRSKHGKEITLSLDLARLMSAVERGRGRLKAMKAENTRPRLPDSHPFSRWFS